MIYDINFPNDENKKYGQFRYPAGEIQVRFKFDESRKLAHADKVFIRATIKDGEIMALAQLTSAIRGVTAAPITLLLPYLPYARADRRFVDGDCFGLDAFAGALNSLNYEKVVVLDVHSASAYRIRNIVQVSPMSIIESILTDIPERTVFVLPDEGAKRYPLEYVLQCTKVRNPENGNLSGFIVPIKRDFIGYKRALIIDDICDGGRTFIGIAKQLKDYGLELYLYITHGIFSQGLDELNQYFEKIYTTDSLYPTPSEKLMVVPCDGLLRSAVLSTAELWKTA